MISDTALLLAYLFIWLGSPIIRPQHARCPRGWYVEGVRESGRTQCRPVPPVMCGDGSYDPCPQDDRALPLQIYCTNGTRPIVVDNRAIGCQRRP